MIMSKRARRREFRWMKAAILRLCREHAEMHQAWARQREANLSLAEEIVRLTMKLARLTEGQQ